MCLNIAMKSRSVKLVPINTTGVVENRIFNDWVNVPFSS